MSFPSGTDIGAMVLATAAAANSLAAVQRKGNRKAEFIVVRQIYNMRTASYTNIIAASGWTSSGQIGGKHLLQLQQNMMHFSSHCFRGRKRVYEEDSNLP